VTEVAVEINSRLTEIVIRNEHCADFDSDCCLILGRFGYRVWWAIKGTLMLDLAINELR
jgi:hypothetical protein